jgi:dihydrofolate reductase
MISSPNMISSPKVILYIAMSRDGFIAGADGQLDFLDPYQVEGEDYGYSEFMHTIGSIIVGRKTYETVLGMGYPYHPDLQVIVASRSGMKSEQKNLVYYGGLWRPLIDQLKATQENNIYCDGGAELARSLINEQLIDEIILSVIPVSLYQGTLLFEQGLVPSDFELMSKKSFQSGLEQCHYQRLSTF